MSFVSTSDTECPVGLEFTLCICDGTGCLCEIWIREGNGSAGSRGLDVFRLIRLLAKRVVSTSK